MRVGLRSTLILPVTLAAAVLLAAGCGSSDSQPAYCSNVTALQESVDNLKGLQLQSGVLSTLQTDLQQVQSDAEAVVSSAKADFPNQTSALESSVSSLSTSIKKLPKSATPQQLLALAPEISSTVAAAQDLSSATSSACD